MYIVNTSEQILVVFLSVTLAVMLIVAIVVLYKLQQLIADVRRIVQKAESLTDKAGDVANFFQNTTVTGAIVKIISNVMGGRGGRSTKNNDGK